MGEAGDFFFVFDGINLQIMSFSAAILLPMRSNNQQYLM
jgi:hypothetical protein